MKTKNVQFIIHIKNDKLNSIYIIRKFQISFIIICIYTRYEYYCNGNEFKSKSLIHQFLRGIKY